MEKGKSSVWIGKLISDRENECGIVEAVELVAMAVDERSEYAMAGIRQSRMGEKFQKTNTKLVPTFGRDQFIDLGN
jgi:hypothetical protein